MITKRLLLDYIVELEARIADLGASQARLERTVAKMTSSKRDRAQDQGKRRPGRPRKQA